MHKAVLGGAAVAAAALFAPAVAQQMNQHEMNNGQPQMGQSQSGQEPQAQQRPIPGASQAMAGRAIVPELLNAHQIRDIQQALEARGAQSIRTDGRWGDDIEAAVRNFQRMENMISQNGELDPLTLMALGLNPLNFFGPSGASETTGQALQDGAAPREQMREAPEQPMREQPIREQEPR
jgi:peptidoglycan hydrolase-like protein with peptidoglycan-binding domain